MRKSQRTTGHRPLRAGLVVAAAAAVAVAGTSTAAFATNAYTLSASQVGTGSVIYLTGTGTSFSASEGVRFVSPASAACPTTYGGTSATTGATTVSAGAMVGYIDATDAYVTIPAVVAGSTYAICLYADTTNSGAVVTADATVNTLTAVNMGTLSAVTGQAADKITLTASSAIFTGSTYATEFVSGVTACASTYTTTSSTVISAATTKTSTSILTITVPTLVAGTSYLVCTYSGTTAGTSTLSARGSVSFASYSNTLPTITLNPPGGSSATSTSVTISAATGTTPFTSTAPAALLARNSCPLTYAAGTTPLEPYAATNTTKISTSKLAITVPTSVVVGGLDVTTPWNVCIYSSTSGNLVATPTTYTVAPQLTISSVQYTVGSASAANTGSGPAQGGQLITISNVTGIPSAAAVTAGAKLTASIGGSPLTNITPIDSTSFSGVTTAHAAGVEELSVSTAAGTKTNPASNTHTYTYTYGITVSPNTAPTGTTPVLDITGAGFGSLTFSDVSSTVALAAQTAYVLLTDNTWNAQTFTALNAQAVKAITYCNTILPISDTEIICTLALDHVVASVSGNAPTTAGTNVPVGTYTVTVVNSGTGLDSTSYNYSIVSSGSTFTVSPY